MGINRTKVSVDTIRLNAEQMSKEKKIWKNTNTVIHLIFQMLPVYHGFRKHTFPVCYLSEPRRICGKRHRTNSTTHTCLHVPINSHKVPGNNQTPNNAIIVPGFRCSLPLSLIIKACLTGQCSICAAHGGSLLLLLNTKLYYWRLHPPQCLLISPPVSVLILEMFSVANKSIMRSYTCSICKWIAVPHIASDGNQKNIVLWEKE